MCTEICFWVNSGTPADESLNHVMGVSCLCHSCLVFLLIYRKFYQAVGIRWQRSPVILKRFYLWIFYLQEHVKHHDLRDHETKIFFPLGHKLIDQVFQGQLLLTQLPLSHLPTRNVQVPLEKETSPLPCTGDRVCAAFLPTRSGAAVNGGCVLAGARQSTGVAVFLDCSLPEVTWGSA